MRKFAMVCVLLVGLGFLAGCGGEEVSDSAGAPNPASAPVAPGFREQSGPGDQNKQQTVDRKEVVTGSVDMTATDPIAAAASITGRVTELGGRVDERTEQPASEKRNARATLSVRVPADKTEALLTGLADTGDVTRVSTSRADVTMQWEDLDARIRALQASVDRLRTLMATASNTADLIAAESALSSRQGELDSLTGQKRQLDEQIALSTITITVTAPSDRTPSDPDSFWDGVVAGWNSLVDWLQDAVVFAGSAVPWLGLFGIIGGIAWFAWRLVRRGGRKERPGADSAGDDQTEQQ
ncbi:DUF4349 domain-containing protein [Nocardia camponoti]|uniref:DUF4349 domain-containing protein n=1 Tax=Nocardia camponoti TaxID=1616106 RepID=A0A917QMF8_9NOCA|nr:DUF4349 domain-containing protein [Nocardia camponoti]GGK56731.1 hypothetical protein GCM10011591_31070 [Nocardia camponoti]